VLGIVENPLNGVGAQLIFKIAVSLVALAVVATLLLQATTAGWLARKLGLIEEPDSATPTLASTQKEIQWGAGTARKDTVQLTDSHNRKMDYLRISVTDRCNFRCQYCMPEDIQFQDKSHILTYEEILIFAEACLQLGVTKVRVTGGEPLVRRGVVWLISQLKELGFDEVTMTTNGFLLKDNLEGLVEAGLDRINISLDTLQPEKFAFITRRNHFQKVWEAIMAALETPLSPVKINAVAMRGVNDDEISDMARLTLEYPMHVRFIELMPLNGDTDGSHFRSLFISGREILERAQKELGDLKPVEKEDPAAPADEFKFEGAPGTFGVITPVSEPFCARCSRLRLTADGKIHPCLLTDLDVPVKDAIRSEDPIPAIHKVLWETARIKPAAGLTLPEESRNRTMSQIGG
jgi:cyclic pyranopterin phosphate synthase